MKPILQHEQRLQKYANTHPLCVRTSWLADHKKQTAFSQLFLNSIGRRGRRSCCEACCVPAGVPLR
jgi:hypothetical protein